MFEETIAVKPPENPDKIALIDADTIAYATCSVCEYGDDEAGYQIELEYALQVAIDKVQKILHDTGAGSAHLHFTMGKNFRYKVCENYKANRVKDRTPEGLSALKELLAKEYEGSMLHTDVEADDYVVYLKKMFPELYILVAIDKDVLNSVPGKHWNYFHRAEGVNKYGTLLKEIKPKWVETLSETPPIWFYSQVLMGDSGDGIQGVPKCGPVNAIKILVPEIEKQTKELKKAYTEKKNPDLWGDIIVPNNLLEGIVIDELEMWEKVVEAYEEKDLTEKDAIKTARLVSMHQINNEGKLDLWTKPMPSE
jgi:5'-3' exonuclease